MSILDRTHSSLRAGSWRCARAVFAALLLSKTTAARPIQKSRKEPSGPRTGPVLVVGTSNKTAVRSEIDSRSGDDSGRPSCLRVRASGLFPSTPSTRRVSDRLRRRTDDAKDACTFVQEAGDVVLVPANWAHAILNEAPVVGAAFEHLDAYLIASNSRRVFA